MAETIWGAALATALVLAGWTLGTGDAGGTWDAGRTLALVAAALVLAALGLRLLRRAGDRRLHPQGLAVRALDAALSDAASPDPACLMLLPDGRNPVDPARLAAAVLPVLRTSDLICRIDGGVAVTLTPPARLDLDAMIPIAARLQRAARPLGTVSIGFCLPDLASDRSGAALWQATRLAAEEARRQGPGAIRAFRPDLLSRAPASLPRADLESALASGEFLPHFQPQICARTRTLTGVEALARWSHPTRGLLTPGAFLDDIRQTGLSPRLTDGILSQALAQMARWDAAGITVPAVSLNLDAQDLADPLLPDRIAAALDRHGLPAHRLTVEVLETVLADGDAVTVRSIDRLARMGCGVDLDDFGTGQAAIGQLRRLTIRRIKIDRSFVAGLDHDASQRRVVSAILSMADRLGLDTLAEGVESPALAQMLAQMGCGHLQGWAIAKPMPGPEMGQWIAQRTAEPPAAPLPGAVPLNRA